MIQLHISIKYLIRKTMSISNCNIFQRTLQKKGLQNLTKVQQLKPEDAADELNLTLLTFQDEMNAPASYTSSINKPLQYIYHQNYDWIDDIFSFSSGEERYQTCVSNQESHHYQNSTSNQSFAQPAQASKTNLDSNPSKTNLDSNLAIDYPSESSQQREIPKKSRKGKERNLMEDQQDGQNFNHRSQRNIVGYAAKKSIKLLLKKYQKKIAKDCQKAGISLKVFINYYETREKDLYGPEKLSILLKRSQRDDAKINKMKDIFQLYFEKVLRRDYLIQALRKGKMRQIQSYIWRKNSCMLYFADSI